MPNPELTSFTTVFRAAESHRVKRNRQPVSCTACQRRKSKCDRQKPCGACERRGDAAVCRFGPLAGSAGRSEVQARLAKLEEMVKDLAAAGGAEAGSSGSGSRSSGRGIGRHRAEGGGGGGEVEARHESEGEDPARQSEQKANVRTEPIKDEDDGPYHGTTSWTALVDNIHDIQTMLDALEKLGEAEDEDVDPPVPDLFLDRVPTITKAAIVESLPPRADCRKLIGMYFHANFLQVPFIHVHHFYRRFEAFWTCPDDSSFLWLSIMYSVLSIGAMIAGIRGISGVPAQSLTVSPETARGFMLRAAQCLVTGRYLHAKTFSVEALVMFAHARSVQREDSDASIWSLYGLAVRLAQRRGYHLEADRVSKRLSPFEAEMRRRTWFTIQAADLLFSFQLGMPPMIHEDVCNVDHMRNLQDDEFDEDMLCLPESRPPNEAVEASPVLGWHVKSRLCRVLRRVLQHALSTEPQPYEKTMALNVQLDAFYRDDMPACLRFRPIQNSDPADEGFTIMHRLVLEVMYLKARCLLHREYLSFEKGDLRYEPSRIICRDSAMRIVRMHIELDAATQPGGRMYEDRFMVSNLTLHEFLVAAMIICLDLSENVDMNLADRQERVSLLHQTCNIWVRRSAHSRDAVFASRVMRAILNRAQTPSFTNATSTTSESARSLSSETVGGAALEPDLASMQLTDYPVNFDELPPLDNFFGNREGLDWSSVDQYLRFEYLPVDLVLMDTTDM